MKIYGSIKELVSAVFRIGIRQVTVNPPAAPAADRTITLPDATDTLVGKATTDTFTNKTFDADGTGNSITNIENADIKSGAAIDRTKLASGTNNHVVINNGSGVLSSEAQLAATRGGTGISSTATFPASGVVVTEAGSATLSNKTLLTPVIDDYFDLNEEAAPSTPASGKVRVYAKTDNKLYLKDDLGTETAVGSGGSGELNLVENPSDATNWSETGTVFSTPATTTTAGDLPLGGLTDTAIQLVASGSGSESTAYNSYSFTTPASLSGKMKVEFYQRPGTGFAESEWTVSVYQSTTRQSLSTDSSGVTYLVNANNKRTVYVDLLASTAYTLRFARIAGSGSATLNISNVIVGPGIQPQGAVVGEWQSYTPTGSWTTNTTYRGNWRRVGDNIELLINVYLSGAPGGTTALNFTGAQLLNGLNLTYAPKYPDLTGEVKQPVGTWFGTDQALLDFIGTIGITDAVNSTPTFTMLYQLDTTASSGIITKTAPFTWGADDNIGLKLSIPIAEWAGSGTVNLAQNDVEYAYTTGTWDAADTTTGYGPAGAVISGALTASRKKTITWQTPIQVGDVEVIEIQMGGVGPWVPMIGAADSGIVNIGIAPYNFAGTGIGANTYGVHLSRNSSSVTQSLVEFGLSCVAYYDGTSWVKLGWDQLTSGSKWRVRKSSAGAAVGFGIVQPGVSSGLVSASGLPGRTDGAAITSGYVGEKITWATPPGSTQSLTTTMADWTNAFLTLNKGTYLVIANIVVDYTTAASAGANGNALVHITDSSNAIVQNMNKSMFVTASGSSAARGLGTIPFSFVANIGTDGTVYKIRAQRTDLSGTGTGTIYNTNTAQSEFFAVRIG